MEKNFEKYATIIDEMEMQEGVSLSQFKELISNHIIKVDSSLEAVTLRTEGESITSKPENLRFRLKELIKLTVKTAADIWSGNPIAIVLKVIEFLQEVKKLSTISISKNDAVVLAAIWIVKLEKPSNLWPDNEEVRDYLKKDLTEDAIETSLENLKKLGCIARTDHYIKIEEEIVI